jgi:hypothetical protein
MPLLLFGPRPGDPWKPGGSGSAPFDELPEEGVLQ